MKKCLQFANNDTLIKFSFNLQWTNIVVCTTLMVFTVCCFVIKVFLSTTLILPKPFNKSFIYHASNFYSVCFLFLLHRNVVWWDFCDYWVVKIPFQCSCKIPDCYDSNSVPTYAVCCLSIVNRECCWQIPEYAYDDKGNQPQPHMLFGFLQGIIKIIWI